MVELLRRSAMGRSRAVSLTSRHGERSRGNGRPRGIMHAYYTRLGPRSEERRARCRPWARRRGWRAPTRRGDGAAALAPRLAITALQTRQRPRASKVRMWTLCSGPPAAATRRSDFCRRARAAAARATAAPRAAARRGAASRRRAAHPRRRRRRRRRARPPRERALQPHAQLGRRGGHRVRELLLRVARPRGTAPARRAGGAAARAHRAPSAGGAAGRGGGAAVTGSATAGFGGVGAAAGFGGVGGGESNRLECAAVGAGDSPRASRRRRCAAATRSSAAYRRGDDSTGGRGEAGGWFLAAARRVEAAQIARARRANALSRSATSAVYADSAAARWACAASWVGRICEGRRTSAATTAERKRDGAWSVAARAGKPTRWQSLRTAHARAYRLFSPLNFAVLVMARTLTNRLYLSG